MCVWENSWWHTKITNTVCLCVSITSEEDFPWSSSSPLHTHHRHVLRKIKTFLRHPNVFLHNFLLAYRNHHASTLRHVIFFINTHCCHRVSLSPRKKLIRQLLRLWMKKKMEWEMKMRTMSTLEYGGMRRTFFSATYSSRAWIFLLFYFDIVYDDDKMTTTWSIQDDTHKHIVQKMRWMNRDILCHCLSMVLVRSDIQY